MLQKQIFTLAMLCLAIWGMTACRTSKEEQAVKTIDDFFGSIEDNDFEKAKEMSTEDSKPILVKVEKEAKDYRKDVKPEKVEVEVLDKKIVDDKEALVTVNIKVGPKVKKEKIKLVLVNEKWLIVVKKPQVQVVRYVVFYDQYEVIVLPKIRIIKPTLVIEEEEDDHHHHHHKHKHHPRGHAYGHDKHHH
ncbi:DUF4878 domain-containing protein [Cytophagaceae bacterium YF14B1]|uniref:DUF4878 domain-containing protein n=1 Tax=Xanthocytophaga flava TaxID=3048013 RepID=A0AAE3QYC7_9BACT|nr:DUF4878 domain-containing protein [Xanthocytophaga flavus]MDJ1485810.1 DUF4878 domain-containing protein [Xanthocytophaga flavus]